MLISELLKFLKNIASNFKRTHKSKLPNYEEPVIKFRNASIPKDPKAYFEKHKSFVKSVQQLADNVDDMIERFVKHSEFDISNQTIVAQKSLLCYSS